MISQATYEAVASEASDHQWELFDGRLVEKPRMSIPHNRLMARLNAQLVRQLNVDQFEVRMNTGRVRSSGRNFYVPDVHVIPVELLEMSVAAGVELEILDQALPFVAEVWSPSTGDYDVDEKFPIYRQRGDLEIWRLHPYERTLTAWRQRADGGYDESIQKGGVVHPVGLPNVTIDLDDLFNLG